MLTIAIEGIDGSGKDTLIKYLGENLNSLNLEYKPNIFSQCTDSLLGRRIRSKIKQQDSDDFMLSAAFMCEMISTSKQLIKLASCRTITILNRWIYSTLAYGCTNEEMDYFINIKHSIYIPDIVIYLDVPINIAIERICKRNGQDFDKYENSDVLTAVREKYMDIFSKRLCFNDSTYFLQLDSTSETYKQEALDYIISKYDRGDF